MAAIRAVSLSVAIAALRVRAQDVDYTQFVNPFIGSEGKIPGYVYGGGNVFVGGAVPFGMVKLGLDTYEEPVNQSALNGGWTPQGKVTGISLMHESGTGGGPKYGFPAQMPLASIEAPVNLLDNRTYWQSRDGEDDAKVGYFRTHFESDITVELSASRHAGLYHYTYPSPSEKHVLVDFSHYLPHPTRSWDSQFYTGGEIEIQPNSSVYTGYASIANGWCLGAPVVVYVCGEFDSPPDEARAFSGKNTFPVGRHFRTSGNDSTPEPTFPGSTARSGPMNDRVGAVFTWNGTDNSPEVKSRVGISFMSVDKACAYKNEELPSWDIGTTAQAARDEWNRDVFSKIRVDTTERANRTRLALLYSSLYFMHLIPSERVGENPLWESDEPYWDDFYTMWDLFRNQVSLWHLIQPAYYESMIRSLIDMFKHEGYLPDGRSGNYNGLVQGGSNADNVLADAYVKGLRGAINWTEGYAAVKKDAEVVPFFDQNPVDAQGSLKEGRGALDDWIPLGYVSADRNTRAVSKTVEYSLNDFAVAQIAAGEEQGDRDLYMRRSAGWQMSWDPEAESRGFSGFVMPRYSNGTFHKTYDITDCGECNWGDESYEGTAFEYSFVIPHDVERVIELMGGPQHFEERLDYVFQPTTSGVDLGVNGYGITTINNVANEPDFQTPYLYNYLNKQWKSVERSRQLANDFYFNTSDGIPGNSDAGALNCWLIWQMLGLYPVVTTPVYLLESPWFEDVNITINHNRTLRIRADGLDDGDGRQGYYVQGVTINGETWTKNWFEHEDVGGIMTEGGEIVFKLGPEQTVWETGEVPPSPAHTVLDFDFDLTRRYLAASPGSQAYEAGLTELMVVSVHQIAAYIYKMDLDIGNHKSLPKMDIDDPDFFIHNQYKDTDQYPDGVADAVGYWAEAQIFGGVILFDRRQQYGPAKIRGDDCFLPWNRGEAARRNLQLLDPEEWKDYEFFLSEYRALKQPLHEQDPYEIYFHSDKRDVTYRIWQLLPEQRRDMFEFLLSKTEPAKSPFPMLPSEKNLFRIDPEDPITETRIFRDVWERKPLGDDDVDKRSHHCRGNKVEYPFRADEDRSKNRAFFRNELIWEIKSLEDRASELAAERGQGLQPEADLPPTQD